MNSSWSGMISFGLVNIPVKLYAATRDQDISFNQLHKEDNGRVKYKKVCSIDGQELAKEDIVRAYEYTKGQYVVVTDEDMQSVNVKSARTIEISKFVDSSEVDEIAFERSYFIGPNTNGERAYALFRAALADTRKTAIGKISMLKREKLAAISVSDNTLVLQTMHFADEVMKPEGIGVPAADFKVTEAEVGMAKVLVEHMTGPFDLSEYKDEYETALKDLINKKVEGQEIAAPQEIHPTLVNDIMSVLKASVEKAEKEGKKTAGAGK